MCGTPQCAAIPIPCKASFARLASHCPRRGGATALGYKGEGVIPKSFLGNFLDI